MSLKIVFLFNFICYGAPAQLFFFHATTHLFIHSHALFHWFLFWIFPLNFSSKIACFFKHSHWLKKIVWKLASFFYSGWIFLFFCFTILWMIQVHKSFLSLRNYVLGNLLKITKLTGCFRSIWFLYILLYSFYKIFVVWFPFFSWRI